MCHVGNYVSIIGPNYMHERTANQGTTQDAHTHLDVTAYHPGCYRGAGDHEGQGGSLVIEGNQWCRDRRHPPKFWAVGKSSFAARAGGSSRGSGALSFSHSWRFRSSRDIFTRDSRNCYSAS